MVKGMSRYKRVISIILIIFISVLMLVVNVNAKEDLSFDYSKDASTTYKELAPSKLVEIISSNEITIQEKTYLDQNFESLRYDDLISPNKISTNLVGDKLDVHANEYSYVDKQNRLITWVPYKASYEDTEKDFVKEGDVYKTTFDNIQTSDAINVTYKTIISLPVDKVNQLLNASYNHVDSYVVNHIYEDNIAVYNANLALYNQYLLDIQKYESDSLEYLLYLEQKEKYDKYLNEYSKYQEELAKYNQYLENINKYNDDLLAYQNYLDELAYYNENYESNLQEYNEYVVKKTKVDKQLYVMSLIKKEMTSLNRTVYDAVMGSSVTEVLERKSELLELGVQEETINRANDATINLREIFTQYFSYQEDADKYAYYISNYFKIKRNMEELLRCLDKLYRSGATHTALDYLDKTEKYIILVAQLALICNGLDDSDVYNYEAWNVSTNKGNLKLNGALVIDYNWTIDSRTFTRILDNITYIENDGIEALPLFTGYPSVVEKLEKPEEVSVPVYPEAVPCPVEPTKVDAPTATVTAQPVKPAVVTEPVEYVRPSDITSLLEVYNTTLAKRSLLTSDYDLVLYSTLNKKFRNLEEITVEFYNTDKTFLTKYTISNGSYIVYDNKIPTKDKDAKYTYVFSGWEYENHEILDLNCVTREGFVYPIFTNILNEYEVTWDIDGTIVKETYYYEDTPICKENLLKDNTDTTIFIFDSWDKEITPVTGNITYKALYKEVQVPDGLLVVNDEVDFKEILDSITDINGLNAVITKEDYDINIPTSTLIKMKNDGVSNLDLIITKDKDTTFTINVNNSYTFNVVIDMVVDTTHARLYSDNDLIRYSYENGKLSFTMNSNTVYSLEYYYSINLLKNDIVKFSVENEFAKCGDMVNISIDEIRNGIKINRVYYVNTSMGEVVIDSNKFEMPNDDVYIGISYSYIEYIVTFISDGVVIKEDKYHYGDIVNTPQDPKKASDDEYSYEFVGWDKTITEVNDNAVYTAVFENHPVVRPVIEDKISIIRIIKIVGIISLAGCCVGLVIALTRKKAKKI